MKITKTTAQLMRKDLEKAMANFEKQYGVKVQFGNGRFSDTNFNMKIDINVISETSSGNTVAMTPKAKAFIQRAKSIGFHESLLGETMRYEGKNVVITGYNTRAPKNPIEFTENGKNYKCSIGYIKKVVSSARPEYNL